MMLEGTIIGLDRMFSLGSILSSPVLADGVLYSAAPMETSTR